MKYICVKILACLWGFFYIIIKKIGKFAKIWLAQNLNKSAISLFASMVFRIKDLCSVQKLKKVTVVQPHYP